MLRIRGDSSNEHERHEFAARDIETSIVSRFERQVDAFPDRVALKASDEVLTYSDLDRASNRVANAILAMLGDREEPVVVLVEPGATAIVLLLGVLKAGKFYAPLDPSHPSIRLGAIVRDVDPALIVTTTAHSRLAGEIALDTTRVLDCERLVAVSEQAPGVQRSADGIGYLFYTSGSTGRPKGVIQTQRNILHQIRTYTNGLRIAPDDRLTLLHSHAFSASRLEIFGALLNGASLFPFSVTDAGLPKLVRWLADEEITLSHWVPTLFRYFGKALEGQRFPAMRVVVLGSEPMLPGDIAVFKNSFDTHCVLVNRFGSTEAGNMCWSFVDRNTDVASGVVPVGVPVPGADVFVRDERGKRAEAGQVGELCVRSAYLSPGYWKNPDLTRAVFLPDPRADGSRIYLTGDLGRQRSDGAFEHLGRKDTQAKIRGFRVETQEVEAALSTHPDLQESMIDVLRNDEGESRLTAYVVPVAGRIVRTDDVREFLAKALPHYMVPSSIVLVDAFPRTPTGKVDRLALAAMHGDPVPASRSVPDPVDPIERTLVGIWAHILGGIAVTATDNFFALGGNSLLAAQLMMRIERTFGRQLSPSDVFAAPTVRQLAKVLREGQGQGVSFPSLVPIQPRGTQSPFFWIHGDRSNAYLSEYLGSDQPLYGFLHQSLDGRPAAYDRVETLAGYYVRQIQTLHPGGPYLLGGYSFGGTVAFEVAQQLKEKGQTVCLLVMLDSLFPGTDAAATMPNERTSLPTWPVVRRAPSRLETLAQLGFREGIRYVRVGVMNRVNGKIDKALGPTFKTLVCQACWRFNWRLPVFARSFYIAEIIYRNALRQYSPRPFAGRAIYFKTTTRTGVHLERWKNLMADGLEVHEVPGDHLDVIQPEKAGAWAVRLARLVANVQRRS